MKFIYSQKHNQEDAIIYYNANLGSWDLNSQDGFDQNSNAVYLFFITSGKSCS